MRTGANRPLLELCDVSIRFGGIRAVDGVSLEIERGEISAIIGPNGSGKTTVFNIVSGFYRPDSGTVRFNGHDITRAKPHAVARLGIGRTYQNLELFGRMTVEENLLVAMHMHTRTDFLRELLRTPGVRAEESRIRTQVESILQFLGLERYAAIPVSDLPFPVQKRIELGRALSLDPKLLLLDEPAAGLNAVETEELSRLIREISGNLCPAVLLIEHDMSMVMTISDRVAVLDYGKVISQGVPGEVQNDPQVIRAYLGTGEINVLA